MAEKTLKTKLAEIQQTISVPKTLYNSFGGYNYRNAEGILETLKPVLKKMKVGLTLEDSLEAFGDRVFLKATAILFDLETEESATVSAYAELSDHKGMSKDQETGCASSYARKYALNGMFLLDDVKDADTDEHKKESEAKASRDTSSGSTYKSTGKSGASGSWGLK